MITPVLLSVLGSVVGTAVAQTFEPVDFNVTEGLLDLGIDVTQLPELSDLVERSTNSHCAAACLSLSTIYGDDAVYTQDEAPYSEFTGAYWSLNQAEVDPYCIFKPARSADVAVLVLLSRLTQCPFAIKSGGHAAFAGSSNIEGGITVALEKLNGIKLSDDKTTVTIQPGNRWSSVYAELDKSGLTVTGGRVSTVGTGGLTLGGGISFVSNVHGWACDNVISYEVVTASGIIVRATPTSHPSLYWALRGGGNNFGIVTAFTFETHPLPGGQVWGGTKTFLETDFDAVTDAFAGVVADSPQDPNAGLWVAWIKNNGLKLAATELWYAKADGSGAAIFDAFNAITPIADTTQTRILHEYTDVQQDSNPYGLREVYWALTVKANADMAKIARDIFFEELPAVADVSGANPVLIFQGITVSQMNHMSKNGGNPLGLDPADGPLYLMHIACWWENAADDQTIYAFISEVLTRIDASAKELGVQNDYIYMNYASPFEDVIASYGADNVAKLKKIASLYDPTGIFQTLQPGHFKLGGAPVPNSGYYSGL